MIRKILCFLGFHLWDGHTEEEYPAPRCTVCGKWHPRHAKEHWLYMDDK